MASGYSNPPPTPSGSNGPPDWAAIFAIITIPSVGVLVLIVIAIWITKRYQKLRAPPPTDALNEVSIGTARPSGSLAKRDLEFGIEPVESFLEVVLREKPMRFTPQNIIDFTQNYSHKLGSGGFGVVYRGQFPNGLPIAVKILNSSIVKRCKEQFTAEVGTIGRTNHVNLVLLYGFCLDVTVKALVYEYVEKGSLDENLFGEEGHKVQWEKLYGIALGTARGIRYLHEECQNKIVHYDIKPANVLLTQSYIPKVADFGLATFCDRERCVALASGGRGTPGYAAPEMWTGSALPMNDKCDVYSFGMLLFEILGRRKNYLDLKQGESQDWFPLWVWRGFNQGETERLLCVCGIEDKDREEAERMCRVALWCVQHQPEARPSMNSVVRMLEGELVLGVPGNPFHHMTPFGEVVPDLCDESSAESASQVTEECASQLD